MLNMTVIPEVFGDLLGLSIESGGVFVSVLVVLVFTFSISLLTDGFNILPIVITSIGLFTMFTFFGWFPIWILIIIALLTAILYSKEIVKVIGGRG